ncbi:MAG: hypothetical protein CMN84_10095 [Spongiibacteraceae bacterium]|jgi:hypothetical protein|nr:hypothetical protein [Spongiibacteraceae bacterium]|tara:strand:+ start:193 stop:1116 length:924 start_codon:yes stop_codon:yes gene_type:complete
MIIAQKSVRSIAKYIKAFKEGQKVRLAVEIDADKLDRAHKAGFSKSAAHGDTILPNAINPTTQFNSEGKRIPLKEKPKESRYITTIEWSWEQWDGHGSTKTVTEARDIYKDCYQQKFIPPPALEITWITTDNKPLVISEAFEIGKTAHEMLRHAVNLFLAIFEECEIRKEDLSTFSPTTVKRLNWKFLPPGEHPWEHVKNHVKTLVKEKHSRYSNIILQRQEAVMNYQPDEVFVGNGGFRSYIAYVFKEKTIVLLESVESGNATYVFGDDWEEFSMLTKAEILNNQYNKDRIIHSKGWWQQLNNTLD